VKLVAAMLCESVSIRENLLHVLGGGVTVVRRPIPSPLGLWLATQLVVSVDELGSEGVLRVSIVNEAEREVAGAEMGFGSAAHARVVPDPSWHPSTFSMIVPTAAIVIKEAGQYFVRVSLDGEFVSELPIFVEQIPPVGKPNEPTAATESFPETVVPQV
jgi:hypothetical protein